MREACCRTVTARPVSGGTSTGSSIFYWIWLLSRRCRVFSVEVCIASRIYRRKQTSRI